MKKVGICTLYYKNRNYGANLQAFALQIIVEGLGYSTELISYRNSCMAHCIISNIKQLFWGILKSNKKIKLREKCIDCFNSSIPHSKVYYSDTIERANADYDCFITGSDQVWNPKWINQFMSLGFVKDTERTIAYAASTGKVMLNDEQKEKLENALKNTRYISVREKESIPSLRELTEKSIEYVLDPTLLLSRDEWDNICSERLINDEYIFCYFLCGNTHLRYASIEFAKKKNLKIVTLPCLNGRFRKVDENFGDYTPYEVSPKEFLSLIKYSTFVITDSFHAAVFSHIYEKNFAVTGNAKSEMGCRMDSLTGLFGTENHYIKDYDLVTLESLCAISESGLSIKTEEYEKMKRHSINFLKSVLNNV